MKFLHTSDLHIGLRLCEQPMNDEIAYLLDEIAEIAVREGCQAVVIAGDIYDRSNPAPDSVKLFDNFVSNLVKKGLYVIGISGNHDSAERIGCFSEILQSVGVYFSPAFNGSTMTATLTDELGEVNFILLPFVRPSVCAAYSERENQFLLSGGASFQSLTLLLTMRKADVYLRLRPLPSLYGTRRLSRRHAESG